MRPIEFSSLLSRRIPPTMLPRLYRIGEEGDRRGMPVYLVGGVVRDLLLAAWNEGETVAGGTPESEKGATAPAGGFLLPAWDADLDLVTEGDAVALAQALGPIFGARVKVHKAFGTATLEFPEGSHIDLTTSRQERYPRPGALPVVEPAPLEEDLFRRDFTINAMALRLGEHHVEMVDPYSGAADLRQGTLRILHPRSFEDDPTRIMRGARFEARFGFRKDPETRRLAEEAVREGRLGTVSKDRFRRELLLGLEESSPWECAERWESLGVLRYLHPELYAEESLLRSAADTLRWFASLRQKENPDRTLLYLMALFAPLSPREAKGVVEDRLGLPNPKAELLVRSLERGPDIAEDAPRLDAPALTKALKSEKLETMLFVAALNPSAREALGQYLQAYRHTKLGVTGDDLLALGARPGPELGAAMQAALDEKLRGKLKTRKKELEFILERLESPREDRPPPLQ